MKASSLQRASCRELVWTHFQPHFQSVLSSTHFVHVVLARDIMTETCYIITAYVPDRELWTADFRKKKVRGDKHEVRDL
jgi:hypothetical protein